MDRGRGSRMEYYVDGNVVRRIDAEPKERLRREREAERVHKAKKRNAKKLYLKEHNRTFCNLMYYSMILSAAVLISGLYLHIQSDITARTRNISRLETSVAELRLDNNAKMKRIAMTVNLDEVKDAAINQYQMQFARPDQIVYYSIEDSDYMEQYSDIPMK